MGVVSTYAAAVRRGDKKALLDLLNNALPFATKDGNLEVSMLNRETGRASRWRSWWEVRESPYWLERVNQRLIGLPEVVFDIDPAPGEDSETFRARIQYTLMKLKRDGLEILGAFTTGSRGVHVHGLLRDLGNRKGDRVRDLKHFLLKKYGGDLQKAAPRTMIALEGSPHWKTGRVKELIS